MPEVIHKIFNLKLHRGSKTMSDPYFKDNLPARTGGLRMTLDTANARSRCSGTFPFGLFFKKKSPAKETSKNFEMKVNSISKFNYYIYGQRFYRGFGFVAILTLLMLSFLAVSPIVPKTEKVEGASGVEEIPTITITSSSNIASLEIAPESSDGTFAVSTTDQQVAFTVNTNNYTGYTLNIKTVPTDASDDGSKLVNPDNGNTIESITSAIDANTFETGDADTYVNKWGYQPSVFNSAANTNFLPAPTTEESKLDETSRSGSKSYTIGLGARVDYLLVPGTYTHTYTLVATANPVAYAINYYNTADPTTGTTTAIATQASSVNTSANITLNPEYTSDKVPTRQTYTLRGWCDQIPTGGTDDYFPASVCGGNEYSIGSTMPIDPEKDNVGLALYAVWTPTTFADAYKAAGKSTYGTTGLYTMQDMSKDICAAITINEVAQLKDTRESGTYNYYVAKLKDGKCWMTQNLRLGTTTSPLTLTPSDSNVSANYVLNGKRSDGKMPYSTLNPDDRYNSGGNRTTYPYDGNAYYCTPVSGNSYVGCYYNWWTATASTGTSAVTPGTSGYKDVSSSICPSNWYLPTGGGSDGDRPESDFNQLYANYNSATDMLVTGTTTVDNTTGLPRPGLLLSGIYVSGGASNLGTWGLYWSRSAHSKGMAYRLHLDSSAAYPQYYSDKFGGFSVRCVAYGS